MKLLYKLTIFNLIMIINPLFAGRAAELTSSASDIIINLPRSYQKHAPIPSSSEGVQRTFLEQNDSPQIEPEELIPSTEKNKPKKHFLNELNQKRQKKLLAKIADDNYKLYNYLVCTSCICRFLEWPLKFLGGSCLFFGTFLLGSGLLGQLEAIGVKNDIQTIVLRSGFLLELAGGGLIALGVKAKENATLRRNEIFQSLHITTDDSEIEDADFDATTPV